jgi:hypothetical protein
MSSPYSAGSFVASACLDEKVHIKQQHQATADKQHRRKWEGNKPLILYYLLCLNVLVITLPLINKQKNNASMI